MGAAPAAGGGGGGGGMAQPETMTAARVVTVKDWNFETAGRMPGPVY
jgi:hypothetical protein